MNKLTEEYSIGEVFSLIEETQKILTAIQRATTQEMHLTPSQYFILTLLWEQDQRQLSELAAKMNCSGPTITGIVDTLEKKNLVIRIPNPGDRRSLLAALTPKGNSLQKKAPNLEQIYQTCCSGLSNEEYNQLGHLLKLLVDSLNCKPDKR